MYADRLDGCDDFDSIMQTFFMIDEILLTFWKYQESISKIYFKAFEMFLLVENSEIAYFMTLSLSSLILTV